MNLIISEKSDILEQMEDEEEKLKQEIRTLYSAIKSIEKRIAMIEHKTCRPVDSEHKYQDFDTRHDDEYID
jgi:chaperonin cofactor prefoldin